MIVGPPPTSQFRSPRKSRGITNPVGKSWHLAPGTANPHASGRGRRRSLALLRGIRSAQFRNDSNKAYVQALYTYVHMCKALQNMDTDTLGRRRHPTQNRGL